MSLEQIITANEPQQFAFTYGQNPELKRFHMPGDFTDNSLTPLEQLNSFGLANIPPWASLRPLGHLARCMLSSAENKA